MTSTTDRFGSIRNGLLPYNYAIDGVNVREAIELCQKAYANVSVFRNAIDIMSEFANTEIYLEGGTQKAENFLQNGLKRLNYGILEINILESTTEVVMYFYTEWMVSLKLMILQN